MEPFFIILGCVIIIIIIASILFVGYTVKHNSKSENTYCGEDITETIDEHPLTYTHHGVTFKVGDRVISRSNEPDPLMIGTMIRVALVTKGKCPTPIVQDEKDGKEYLCFSLLRHYDETLLAKLSGMETLEQYNYLLAIDGCENNQIKEKYGINYNTFK